MAEYGHVQYCNHRQRERMELELIQEFLYECRYFGIEVDEVEMDFGDGIVLGRNIAR